MKILLSLFWVFIFQPHIYSQGWATTDTALYEFTVTPNPRTEPCTSLNYTRYRVKQSDYKLPLTFLYIANSDLMYFKCDEKSNYLVRARIDFRETEIKGCYNYARKEWLFIAVPDSTVPFIRRIETRFVFKHPHLISRFK